MDFRNFDLLLSDPLTVRVIAAPDGETGGPFTLDAEIEALPERYDHLRSRSTSEEDFKSLGDRLFKCLFQDDLLAIYYESLGQARAAGQGMRLRLGLESAALARLPWELLFTRREGFLAASPTFSICRYMAVTHPVPSLRIELPIQILVAISAPEDLPGLDVEAESQALQNSLETMRSANTVALHFIAGARRENLLTYLQSEPAHVLHFIGHGDWAEGQGMVYLEGENHRAEAVGAEAFAGLLAASPTLRMVVLNACATAYENTRAGFSSVSARLVQQGVPAVLAMGSAIEDRAATSFTRHLYGNLAGGESVDVALARTRQQLRNETFSSPGVFAIPVLYLHSPDGALFEVASARQKMLVRIAQQMAELNESGEALAEWKEIHDLLHILSQHLEPVYQLAANPYGADLIPGIWAQFQETLAGKLLPFASRIRFAGRCYQEQEGARSGEEWSVRTAELAGSLAQALAAARLPVVRETAGQLRVLFTKHLTLCNRRMVDLLEQVRGSYQEARASLDDLRGEGSDPANLPFRWEAIHADLTDLGEHSARIIEWVRLHDLFDRLHIQFATLVASVSSANALPLVAEPWATLRETLVLELLDQARQIAHIGKAYHELPNGDLYGEPWAIDIKRKSDRLDQDIREAALPGRSLEQVRQSILELSTVIKQHYLWVDGNVKKEVSDFSRRGIALQTRITL